MADSRGQKPFSENKYRFVKIPGIRLTTYCYTILTRKPRDILNCEHFLTFRVSIKPSGDIFDLSVKNKQINKDYQPRQRKRKTQIKHNIPPLRKTLFVQSVLNPENIGFEAYHNRAEKHHCGHT